MDCSAHSGLLNVDYLWCEMLPWGWLGECYAGSTMYMDVVLHTHTQAYTYRHTYR